MLKKIGIIVGVVVVVMLALIAYNKFVMKPVNMSIGGIIGGATGNQEKLDTTGYVANVVYLDRNYELVRAYRDTDTNEEYIEYMFYSQAIGYARENSKTLILKLDDKLKSEKETIILTEEDLKEVLVRLK